MTRAPSEQSLGSQLAAQGVDVGDMRDILQKLSTMDRRTEIPQALAQLPDFRSQPGEYKKAIKQLLIEAGVVETLRDEGIDTTLELLVNQHLEARRNINDDGDEGYYPRSEDNDPPDGGGNTPTELISAV